MRRKKQCKNCGDPGTCKHERCYCCNCCRKCGMAMLVADPSVIPVPIILPIIPPPLNPYPINPFSQPWVPMPVIYSGTAAPVPADVTTTHRVTGMDGRYVVPLDGYTNSPMFTYN